ncbi:hypothetical protein COJ96_06800 [Bacillus sp. AFS073361]|uniref:hypothetical protein n=1 Tax=Bacillus sp. AFS073361 TaxID=2033511 RepID=UPI000BF96366|nr:hypothetical protein [Bacillus sp. AFS073361]PFP30122.1 hypothetical protein COJ96_06800 [Bacillus sp. AFS073361]
MKIVTVEYRFEGEIRESENEKGLLLGNKVLVFPNDKCAETGLYNAIISGNDAKVLVDLDADATDYLQERPGTLLNLIFA